MLAKHRFDFAEFDAEAANLDLLVYTSQIFNVAVFQKPRQIARFIEP